MYDFKWVDWNVNHIALHGVTPDEAEWVVNHARRPYPRRHGGGKFEVRGQTLAGDYLLVVFAVEPDARLFVITARPLNENEKRQRIKQQSLKSQARSDHVRERRDHSTLLPLSELLTSNQFKVRRARERE